MTINTLMNTGFSVIDEAGKVLVPKIKQLYENFNVGKITQQEFEQAVKAETETAVKNISAPQGSKKQAEVRPTALTGDINAKPLPAKENFEANGVMRNVDETAALRFNAVEKEAAQKAVSNTMVDQADNFRLRNAVKGGIDDVYSRMKADKKTQAIIRAIADGQEMARAKSREMSKNSGRSNVSKINLDHLTPETKTLIQYSLPQKAIDNPLKKVNNGNVHIQDMAKAINKLNQLKPYIQNGTFDLKTIKPTDNIDEVLARLRVGDWYPRIKDKSSEMKLSFQSERIKPQNGNDTDLPYQNLLKNINKTKEVKYGDHFTVVNRKKVLKPNVQYVTPQGYVYKTNEFGAIVKVEATLKIGMGIRNKYAQKNVGGEYRLFDDDGGHLIGSDFSGSGEIDNLVAMNSQINRAGGKWYNMEKKWRDAIKQGKKVKVNIQPIYNTDNLRPDSFVIKYTLDGTNTKFMNILNKAGG